MMVTVPVAIPVAKPSAAIDTTEESELLHTTDEVMSFPRLSTALNCTWVPLGTVWLDGVTVMEVIWDCTPAPDRLMFKGEFAALLLMVTLPETLPVPAGVKVAVKVVLCVGLRMIPDAPLTLNPVPEIPTFEIVTFEFPELVRIRFMLPLLPIFTLPKFKLDGFAVSCANDGVTVTVAFAELSEAIALWAVIVTGFAGALDGAVYRPVEEIVPTDEFPPATPPTNQFTAVLVVPETVAANCCDRPACTFALVGEIETETCVDGATPEVAAGCIVTKTEFDGPEFPRW
jgi:hypothetical protein